MMPDTGKEIALRKQEERAERLPREWLLPSSYTQASLGTNVLKIPYECGILSKHDLHLTDAYDATTLVSKIADGFLRSVDVVTAFCKRAAVAQQLTNCLTEIFFDEGIARAKQLDEHLKKTGRPIGPLHGLPISLKDSFKVKGYDASLGATAFCFQPCATNSALVDQLLNAGAVLYCKTNVPQTLAALDSHNNVFGRTLNPANTRLTAGGSTGGEGALLALHGSVIGVGTDVGGSIRVPAMCNGLVGVKPSHGRVPYAGQQNGPPEGSSKLGIESTAGPLARNARDCEMLLRVIGNTSPWMYDPDVLPQSWEQQSSSLAHSASTRRQPILRVGIASTDGHVTPLPPVESLMEEVANALRSPSLPTWEAIEIVDVDLTKFGPRCLKVFNGFMSVDGANAWFDHLKKTGEPLSPWLQGRLRRRPPKPLDEVRALQAQKTELQTAFLSVWREDGGFWSTADSKAKKGDRTIDILICPPAPHPVPAIDSWNTTNYTSLFNLLDLPAGTIPVRGIRPADRKGELTRGKPLNGWDERNRKLWMETDREQIYKDSMLSIQVVAPKLMERQLVESMAVLERALAPLMSAASQSKL